MSELIRKNSSKSLLSLVIYTNCKDRMSYSCEKVTDGLNTHSVTMAC